MAAVKTVSQMIRAQRAIDDETQEQAADRLGVVRQTFAEWERGRGLHPDNLTITRARALASYLGIKLERLARALEKSRETV